MDALLPDNCNVRCVRRDKVEPRVPHGSPENAWMYFYRTNASCAAFVATRSSHACHGVLLRTRGCTFTGQLQRAMRLSRQGRATRLAPKPCPQKLFVREGCRDKRVLRGRTYRENPSYVRVVATNATYEGFSRTRPASHLEKQPVPFSRSEAEELEEYEVEDRRHREHAHRADDDRKRPLNPGNREHRAQVLVGVHRVLDVARESQLAALVLLA